MALAVGGSRLAIGVFHQAANGRTVRKPQALCSAVCMLTTGGQRNQWTSRRVRKVAPKGAVSPDGVAAGLSTDTLPSLWNDLRAVRGEALEVFR